MNNHFVELADLNSFERFISDSNGSPVVIFKHSDTCGISARAYQEMLRLAEQKESSASIRIGIVPVQAARAVSNEIEARTGIEHESPQVLIMRGDKVLWSGSHGAVKADRVSQAFEKISSDIE